MTKSCNLCARSNLPVYATDTPPFAQAWTPEEVAEFVACLEWSSREIALGWERRFTELLESESLK